MAVEGISRRQNLLVQKNGGPSVKKHQNMNEKASWGSLEDAHV